MYLSVYIFLLIMSFLQIFKRIFIPIFPFIIILIILSGFRYYVGKDYTVYENIFENVNHLYDFPLIEPGFKFIILILKNLGLNTLGIFFIFSTLSILLYYKGIKKQTNLTYFAFFIFFNTYIITAVFSGIRQGLVMGIFLYLLNDLYKRNFLKVLIGSLIAFSVHTIGILILFLYFVPSKITIKKKYIILALLCSFSFIYYDIDRLIINFFPSYIHMKYIDYAEDFTEKINIIRIVHRTLLILLFFLFYDRIVLASYKLKYFFYLYLIGFFTYMVFSSNLAFATKINQFFRILEVVMIPILFQNITNKTIKVLLFLLVIIWSTGILMLFFQIPENYPYRTWLF